MATCFSMESSSSASRLSNSQETASSKLADNVLLPSTSRLSNPQETASSKNEDDVLLHDVFLCHSGVQKNFVRQLQVDLRRLNISSFFDQDNQSLPKGKEYPGRIFKNIENCKVAVLVLSNDFLKSKWPMLELSRIVSRIVEADGKAKEEEPGLHIFPLFYRISHQDFCQKLEKDEFEEWENIKEKDDFKEEWENIKEKVDRIDLEKWSNFLKFIRDYPWRLSLDRSDCKYTTDVDYRESIVNEVVQLLPHNRLFDDSHVEGKERLCLEIDRKVKEAQEKRGVKVLGLHGIGGCDKTTLCKCLCNFYEAEFKGKVFYIELRNGTTLQTHKQLLQVVCGVDGSALDKVSTKDQVLPILGKFMYDKVFLALDGLYGEDTKSMEDVRSFLMMNFKEGSKIVVTSRHADNFESGRLRPDKILSVCVPRLQEDEATNILLKGTGQNLGELSLQLKERLKIYKMNCDYSDAYNPYALKMLGEYLREEYGNDPNEWQEIPNLADLHWLTHKIYCYHELVMWYLRIGLNYPHLYLGINLLLGKVLLKEFPSLLFILVRALLKVFLSTRGISVFVSFVKAIFRTKEFQELLGRVDFTDLLELSACLISGRN